MTMMMMMMRRISVTAATWEVLEERMAVLGQIVADVTACPGLI